MSGSLAALAWALARIRKAEMDKANKALRKQAKKEKKEKWAEKKRLDNSISKSEKELLDQTHNLSRIEEFPTSSINCPDCQIDLYELNIDGQYLGACNKCRGVWFSPEQLAHFTKNEDDFIDSGFVNRPSRFDCPICESRMVECIYKKHNNLLIDSCRESCGVFF